MRSRSKLSSYTYKPYTKLPDTPEDLVELFDQNAEVLLLMPASKIKRNVLSRRIIQVALRDSKGRTFLRRLPSTSSQSKGLWDLSVSAPVLAGESLEDATRRGISHILGLDTLRLKQVATLPYSESHGLSYLATQFVAGPSRAHPILNPEESSDGMFVEEGELRGLVALEPALFSNRIHWALRNGWIFK